MKVAKLLVKLKFTKEASKPTVGNGLNIREDLEHLYDEMYKSFFQNVCKPGDGQKGVAISTMADIFSKLLVRGLHNMNRVSRKIDIETISIEL